MKLTSKQVFECWQRCERNVIPGHKDTIESLTDELNKEIARMLEEYLEKAPRVVCRNDDGKWSCDEHTGFARATHQARLLDIRPIGKESGECQI